MSDVRWEALHVFYQGSLGALLTDGLFPLLRGRLEGRFFFIRYWNGGPHIRVRLWSAPGGSVLPELKARLEEWLSAHPNGPLNSVEYEQTTRAIEELRSRLLPAEQVLLEPCEPLARGDAVQVREYKFDERRYGSHSIRDFIEDHFCWSSGFAARILTWTVSRHESLAELALYLAAATWQASGLTAEEGARLFRSVSGRSAELMQRGPYNLSVSDPEVRESLRRQLAEGLPASGHSDQLNAILMLWRQTAAELLSGAATLRASGGLLRQEPVPLLLDALHMLNNRLGIFTGAESYVNAFLAEELQSTLPRTIGQYTGAGA
jgi:thiopeptide-type bacteriocin biosynthesis protein